MKSNNNSAFAIQTERDYFMSYFIVASLLLILEPRIQVFFSIQVLLKNFYFLIFELKSWIYNEK